MKIMWISDSIKIPSGFGTQSLNILRKLQESDFDVQQLGWFQLKYIEHEDIPVYPLGPKYGDVHTILKYYEQIDPDIIVSLGDLHMVEPIIRNMTNEVFKNKWIHWLPVDAEPYPDVFDEFIQDIPNLVAMSDFGYNLLKPHVKNNLYKIYHGLDPEIFFPIKEKELIRSKQMNLSGNFTCIMVAQNQWRKNIPSLLIMFEKFARNKDDVKLILHTSPTSHIAHRGWNVPELIKQLGLKHKVLISYEKIPERDLNFMYNCAHVFTLATQGEGFGIPAVEAMMAGLPVILTDYTTSAEFINENTNICSGKLLPVNEFIYQSEILVKRPIINTNAGAEILEEYYNDWKFNNCTRIYEEGKQGYTKSIERYNLDNIVKQWIQVVDEVYANQEDALKHIIYSAKNEVQMREV